MTQWNCCCQQPPLYW